MKSDSVPLQSEGKRVFENYSIEKRKVAVFLSTAVELIVVIVDSSASRMSHT